MASHGKMERASGLPGIGIAVLLIAGVRERISATGNVMRETTCMNFLMNFLEVAPRYSFSLKSHEEHLAESKVQTNSFEVCGSFGPTP